MQKIKPYKTVVGAMSALDNGGRFYNLFTKANDGEITSQELARAAGVFSDKQKMSLYLDLALSQLTDTDKQRVTLHLSKELKASYEQLAPTWYTVEEAKNQSKTNEAVVITGIPQLIDRRSEFSGFIMMPIVSNNVTTFVMIPIQEMYDIYQLRSDEASEDFFIAHTKSHRKLPEETLHCAGLIKELKAHNNTSAAGDPFLEVAYYDPPPYVEVCLINPGLTSH